jgi:quercetin dioxygenase-like cupin family protein
MSRSPARTVTYHIAIMFGPAARRKKRSVAVAPVAARVRRCNKWRPLQDKSKMRTTFGKASIAAALLLLAGVATPARVAAQSASAPAASPAPPGPDFASAADVRAQAAAMLAEMKPEQGFMWRPLVRDGSRVAAIEIWRKPGRPAVHPAEAEYAIVLEGAGTLISGGTLVAPVTRREGLVEGDRIDGGTTRPLRPGDVLLLPAGVPHWFGITGDRLVLLGTKLPVR